MWEKDKTRKSRKKKIQSPLPSNFLKLLLFLREHTDSHNVCSLGGEGKPAQRSEPTRHQVRAGSP